MIDLGGMDEFDEVMEEEMCDPEIERDDFNDRVFKAWKLQRKNWRKKGLKERKDVEEYFGMIYSPVKTCADERKPDKMKKVMKDRNLKESCKPMKTMMDNFVIKNPRKLDSDKEFERHLERNQEKWKKKENIQKEKEAGRV